MSVGHLFNRDYAETRQADAATNQDLEKPPFLSADKRLGLLTIVGPEACVISSWSCSAPAVAISSASVPRTVPSGSGCHACGLKGDPH
jgi:hypothetical protein